MDRDHTFSHLLRLERASYHLQDLRNQVRIWLEQDPYRYVTGPGSQGENTIARVQFTIPPRAEFRLIIGDCLHNLRAALDNLVYELASAYTAPEPISEDDARELAFPIVYRAMTPHQFKTKYRSRIGLLAPEAQAIIEEFQPYYRGDDYASHPLWKLNRLSNVDKHRVPHITLLAVNTYADFPDAPHLPGRLNINLGPFTDGAEIASYEPFAGEKFKPEVHMDPLLSFGIAFDQESAIMSGDVTIALSWLHHHVANRVVPRLEPFLR